MKLAFRAFDQTGRMVSDTIEATDSIDASEKLRQQGLYVSEISTKLGSSPRLKEASRGGRVRGSPLRNLALFTRQLQVLVSTGTPLVQSLGALERQMKDESWKQIITDTRKRVEGGSTLAESMEAHPECFDTIYRSLISAGESGGKLPLMLDRLAGLTRQQMKVRSSIIGALIYPSLLMCVAVGVMVLMVTFLLPRFGGLYETLDAPLPPTTKFLLRSGGIARGYWWAMLGGLVALIVALKLWLRTEPGQRALHTFFVRAPQLGRMVRSFATARIARVIGVLLEGHVPLLESLGLARQATGNVHFAELIESCEAAVTRGENMSTAMAASGLIDPAIVEAVRSGENTGQLGSLPLTVAEFIDEDNEVIVRSLVSIMEPIILIVLGSMVGLVAISLFMPLFDLAAMTGG